MRARAPWPLHSTPCGDRSGLQSLARPTTPSAYCCPGVRGLANPRSPFVPRAALEDTHVGQLSRGKFAHLHRTPARYTTRSFRWIWASRFHARSPEPSRLNLVSVRQAATLISASFRSALAGRTLARQLRFTSIRLREGLAPSGDRTCSAHMDSMVLRTMSRRGRKLFMVARTRWDDVLMLSSSAPRLMVLAPRWTSADSQRNGLGTTIDRGGRGGYDDDNSAEIDSRLRIVAVRTADILAASGASTDPHTTGDTHSVSTTYHG
mgnify:CR=1 FL=1